MLKTGVMAFRVQANKDSIKALTFQVAKITTDCVYQKIEIIDSIVTFGKVRDLLREVEKLHNLKDFDYLLVYSPYQLADSKEEFLLLSNTLMAEYGIKILIYKD